MATSYPPSASLTAYRIVDLANALGLREDVTHYAVADIKIVGGLDPTPNQSGFWFTAAIGSWRTSEHPIDPMEALLALEAKLRRLCADLALED